MTLRGDNQDMHVLTEQGLYFFLGRSDKPKALPFQKWLAGEVLPAIRKTGSYGSKGGYVAPALPEGEYANLCLPDLPAEVGFMNPRERSRFLALAQETARIGGLSDTRAVHALFLEYCRKLGAACGPQGSKNRSRESVRLFVAECCQAGSHLRRVAISSIYNAYRDWCRDLEGEKLEPVPMNYLIKNLPSILPGCSVSRPRIQGERRWFVQGLALKQDCLYTMC